MSLISKPYTFSSGATIIAAEHNSNFDILYSDYNGNITTANIASNAAIEYSKLSLSNSIANSDISSSTTIDASKIKTGTSAGDIVILDGSAKLPAVDASQLTNLTASQISGSGFGSWASKSIGTSYLASTDGFVLAMVTTLSNNNSELSGLTDGSNPPTTQRAGMSLNAGAGGSGNYLSIMFPVRKGDYYKVTQFTADSSQMFWLPLGS